MEASTKSCWSIGLLFLTIFTSSILTASLEGSFKQPDVSYDESPVNTPLLDTAGQVTSKTCSTPTTTVTLQPTTSTVHATFTSTKVRVVKRAVVSTETVFGSTATTTLLETVTVSATPTSEILRSTAVVSPSVSILQGTVLSNDSVESNEVNVTSSAAEPAANKTIGVRLTNIVRRVVTMTMGLLLTPIAAVAQHLNTN